MFIDVYFFIVNLARLKWFGHMERMYEERQVKRINYVGRDAREEAERKTAYQMERCAPKRSGGEWTELRGNCCGGPGP